MDAQPAMGRPAVTIVFLVYNRRDELRESLRRMLRESDYDMSRVDVIVVDNASDDGSPEMVREEFPEVQLRVRSENVGVSGWNEGLAAATGDYLLLLDDDCYLPPDGLRRAVEAAEEHAADLVSFKVWSTYDPQYIFSEAYRTGLFMFWGCAVLMRRRVVEALGGYDPEIFVLANELEFVVRFFDRGFRHLHLPEVVAQHMKRVGPDEGFRAYRRNTHHWAYIAAKLLHPRHAVGALLALLTVNVRDAIRKKPPLRVSAPETVRGFVHGLRHRSPVRNPEVSRAYRHDFQTFVNPLRLSRSPREVLRTLPEELSVRATRRNPPEYADRHRRFYEERARFYPLEAAMLEFPASENGDRERGARVKLIR